MSTLQVQTLQGPTSGADSNTVRVADGHNLHAKGHVVQCVETSVSNSPQIDIGSDSFVSTGITLSFTPEFIGSKVFVEYVSSMGYVPADAAIRITLFKDGVIAMGGYGLGYVNSPDGYAAYGKTGGQYIFTTTSLTTIEFTVYARKSKGTGSVTPVFVNSSYTLSATEIAQ